MAQIEKGHLYPNSTQCPNALLQVVMPKLLGSSFKVLMAIVRKTYGFQKDSDKISLTTLQKLTGLSRSAVSDAIKDLGPLLNIVPGAKNVRGLEGVNEYSLNLDFCGDWVDWYENHTSTKKQHRLVRKSYSSKQSISKQSKTEELDELIPAPKDPTPKKKKKQNPAPSPETVEGFSRFYSEYPRRINRQKAFKAWCDLNPDDKLIAEISGAVTNQKRWRDKLAADPKAFVPEWPYPATWLNGRRWEDECDAPRTNSNATSGWGQELPE